MSSYHSIVMRDIRTLNLAELQEKYDIEIDDETNEVYDRVEDRTFRTLTAWADYLAELEARDAEEYNYFAPKQGRDDED